MSHTSNKSEINLVMQCWSMIQSHLPPIIASLPRCRRQPEVIRQNLIESAARRRAANDILTPHHHIAVPPLPTNHEAPVFARLVRDAFASWRVILRSKLLARCVIKHDPELCSRTSRNSQRFGAYRHWCCVRCHRGLCVLSHSLSKNEDTNRNRAGKVWQR